MVVRNNESKESQNIGCVTKLIEIPREMVKRTVRVSVGTVR